MEYLSYSLEDTQGIARELLSSLQPSNKAKVIALSGDLGAGKTALAKCIATALDVSDTVTSPTFVIMKKYELQNNETSFTTLIHIDAYRLKSGQELEMLNFRKEVENRENLILIEWPEIVQNVLPRDRVTVTCQFIDPMTRSYLW